MTLFDGFPPILRGFDVIKVVCVRYNLYRSYNCEITTVVSVTISHDFTVLPSSMNRNNVTGVRPKKQSRTSGEGQTIAHLRPRPRRSATASYLFANELPGLRGVIGIGPDLDVGAACRAPIVDVQRFAAVGID